MESKSTMIKRTLTGNYRHRVETRWFRKPLLVLQAEVHCKGYTLGDAYPGDTRDVDEFVWQDAGLENLKVFKL